MFTPTHTPYGPQVIDRAQYAPDRQATGQQQKSTSSPLHIARGVSVIDTANELNPRARSEAVPQYADDAYANGREADDRGEIKCPMGDNVSIGSAR